jgi:hypothetical protein
VGKKIIGHVGIILISKQVIQIFKFKFMYTMSM